MLLQSVILLKRDVLVRKARPQAGLRGIPFIGILILSRGSTLVEPLRDGN